LPIPKAKTDDLLNMCNSGIIPGVISSFSVISYMSIPTTEIPPADSEED
jgi:hypothetical protein